MTRTIVKAADIRIEEVTLRKGYKSNLVKGLQRTDEDAQHASRVHQRWE